jgi:hypothetical protein
MIRVSSFLLLGGPGIRGKVETMNVVGRTTSLFLYCCFVPNIQPQGGQGGMSTMKER